jgi:predicted nucleotidyltransferase
VYYLLYGAFSMKIGQVLKINDTLQPDVWTDKALNDKVSERLMKIATDFFESFGLEGVDIDDITFTGSLANYNWTKFSDIDLHVLVDFKKIDDNTDLVKEFFNAKSSLWNKMHQILVKDYEIEVYVQDTNEEHYSTGVYSIKNDKWIAEPARVEPKVDTDMVKRKIKSFIDMIDRVEDEYDDKNFEDAYESAISLAKKIKNFRKAGLEDKGEYSNENLTFKYLRNKEFIKTLYDVRNKSYDKMMSLDGDYAKKFNIFMSQDKMSETKGFDRLEEEEKFQKRVRKKHARMKSRLISKGGQGNSPPFTKKPSVKRGKSAPPGFGGV